MAVIGLETAGRELALAALLTVYALVMAFVCVRHARNLVHHLVSESKIRDQKDIISLLLKEFEENSSDWLWEFDRDGRFQRVSERFATAAAGFAGTAGRPRLPRFPAIDRPGERPDPRRASARHRKACDLQRRRAADIGRRRRALLAADGKADLRRFGNYAGYIGTASDVTAEKNAERRINYLAHNDALTGLLNRAKFTEHLKQCVARLERYGSPFVRALSRSRSVQGGQRQPRPSDRRPAARPGRQAHQVDASRGRHCGAARRRRVCDHPQQQLRRRRDGGAGAAARRNGQQALRVRRRASSRSASASASRSRRSTAPGRTRSCATPTSRSTGPRPKAARTFRFFESQMDSDVRAAPHARPRAAPGAAGGRVRAALPAAGFGRGQQTGRASRRWCAGTIRSAASWRRPSSFRSPNRPA